MHKENNCCSFPELICTFFREGPVDIFAQEIMEPLRNELAINRIDMTQIVSHCISLFYYILRQFTVIAH